MEECSSCCQCAKVTLGACLHTIILKLRRRRHWSRLSKIPFHFRAPDFTARRVLLSSSSERERQPRYKVNTILRPKAKGYVNDVELGVNFVLWTHEDQCLGTGLVKIQVFTTPTGYMVWAFGFPYLGGVYSIDSFEMMRNFSKVLNFNW